MGHPPKRQLGFELAFFIFLLQPFVSRVNRSDYPQKTPKTQKQVKDCFSYFFSGRTSGGGGGRYRRLFFEPTR